MARKSEVPYATGGRTLKIRAIGSGRKPVVLPALTGDVAQRLESRNSKSEDPGFDPLAEQGEEQFFSVPPSQLLSRLVCA